MSLKPSGGGFRFDECRIGGILCVLAFAGDTAEAERRRRWCGNDRLAGGDARCADGGGRLVFRFWRGTPLDREACGAWINQATYLLCDRAPCGGAAGLLSREGNCRASSGPARLNLGSQRHSPPHAPASTTSTNRPPWPSRRRNSPRRRRNVSLHRKDWPGLLLTAWDSGQLDGCKTSSPFFLPRMDASRTSSPTSPGSSAPCLGEPCLGA